MAVKATRVAVAAAAVALNVAHDDSTFGKRLTVRNAGANPCDLGGADVTMGTGFALASGAQVTLQLDGGEVLHAIATAVATTELHVLGNS